MFDGLALGSRLAYLDLPYKYRNVLLLGAFFYGITTPIGIAMGLRARMTYIPGSAHGELILRYSWHSKCEYPFSTPDLSTFSPKSSYLA